jgi:hypothetical protein
MNFIVNDTLLLATTALTHLPMLPHVVVAVQVASTDMAVVTAMAVDLLATTPTLVPWLHARLTPPVTLTVKYAFNLVTQQTFDGTISTRSTCQNRRLLLLLSP